MFWCSSDDINISTEAVLGFIVKLVDDAVQKSVIRTNICEALKSPTTAYKAGLASGNMNEYKVVSYNVRRVVKMAKSTDNNVL